MLVFDIETEPQPDESLRQCLPVFDGSKYEVGEFDPRSVKLGNIKKQEIIEEKIETARKAHEQRKSNQACELDIGRQNHWEEFRDAAPLSAVYGRVLAIGLFAPGTGNFFCDPMPGSEDDPEADVLRRFWSKCVDCIHKSRPIVGLNIYQFDLPFMVRRSWILGVQVPNVIARDLQTRWPKWNERFVDLRQLWLLGAGWDTKSNFTTLSHAFGTSGKTEESGKYFWKLWREDPERAVAYLEQDVRQPAEWAKRMGVR